jgi:hypothetical protein
MGQVGRVLCALGSLKHICCLVIRGSGYCYSKISKIDIIYTPACLLEDYGIICPISAENTITITIVLSEYFGFPCQSSFHQILHNHTLWLILTIVTIVILLFHLICQCSVTDLSYIMYNDLQRRNKLNQIKSNIFWRRNMTSNFSS